MFYSMTMEKLRHTHIHTKKSAKLTWRQQWETTGTYTVKQHTHTHTQRGREIRTQTNFIQFPRTKQFPLPLRGNWGWAWDFSFFRQFCFSFLYFTIFLFDFIFVHFVPPSWHCQRNSLFLLLLLARSSHFAALSALITVIIAIVIVIVIVIIVITRPVAVWHTPRAPSPTSATSHELISVPRCKLCVYLQNHRIRQTNGRGDSQQTHQYCM